MTTGPPGACWRRTEFGFASPDRLDAKLPFEENPMKKMAWMITFAGLLIAADVGAQDTQRIPEPVSVVRDQGSLEKLFGIRVGRRTIAFRVLSSGCTSADDFRVLVIASDSNRFPDDSEPAHVLLIRDRLDVCRAVDEIVSIRFPREQLGLEPDQFFVIDNSFVVGWIDPHPRQ
jgi:hypothetical protein